MFLPFGNFGQFLGFTAGVLLVNLAVANLAPPAIRQAFKV